MQFWATKKNEASMIITVTPELTVRASVIIHKPILQTFSARFSVADSVASAVLVVSVARVRLVALFVGMTCAISWRLSLWRRRSDAPKSSMSPKKMSVKLAKAVVPNQAHPLNNVPDAMVRGRLCSNVSLYLALYRRWRLVRNVMAEVKKLKTLVLNVMELVITVVIRLWVSRFRRELITVKA